MFAMGPAFFKAASGGYATLTLSGTFADATVDVAYSSDLTIAGGDGTYSNPRVTVGTLPSWATLSVVSGKLRLSGTPSGGATTINVTVAVDSGDGQTATSAQSVVVAAAGDPYWANVAALLHFDGADGGTSFADEVPANSWIVAAGVTLSTTQKKFGTASGKFSAAGGAYCSALSSLDLGNSDFTIEVFAFFNSLAAYRILAAKGNSAVVVLPWLLSQGSTSNSLEFGYSTNNDGYWQIIDAASVLTTGKWVHIAAVRSAGFISLYLEGARISTPRNIGSAALSSNSSPVSIGANYAGGTSYNSGMDGYLDEFRITKGVARYTSNFTPPASPFPP